LDGEELKAFEKQYQVLSQFVPAADFTIEMRCPNALLLKNIAARGREYEKKMSANYLLKIEKERRKNTKNGHSTPVLSLEFSKFDRTTTKNAVQTIKKYLKDNFGG
jgi:deoxyadenosine/deoxycytidine kinase